MKQRVLTALWGLPLLVACVWFGTPWFSILVAIIAFLCAWEFYRLAVRSGGEPLTIIGLIWILLFIANAHFDSSFTPFLLASAVFFPLLATLFRRRESIFTSWAWTLLGILYIGWMLSHYISLRELAQGRDWVLFALLSTFACDTFAFFVGRAIGRHPLAPGISPGKTWEGGVAGFLAAIGAALLLDALLNLPLGYIKAIFLGCLIGIFAQLGDLVESLLKRNAGVKDSGNLIPGHGGVLDRMDSVVFVGIIVYYYLVWG